ncbi:MAG: phosphomannomutase/phosphoglucomutase [Candidatus Cloacimonetes bacterium]|nr:phosphomannomutase/phosphoglucomutase [Candidatus Cloacimonadota bacterium]
MNPHIFRAYGIRGIYNKDFDKNDSFLIGKAFGSYIQKISGNRIVVGHDNRFSSDEINAHFTQGLLSTGCNITNVGYSLVPIIHYTVINQGFDGGVMITGSHNPKEFNGFKFEGKNAQTLFNQSIKEIEKLTETKKFITGNGEITYQDVFEGYMNAVISRIDLQQPLKIVIDAGNGTASGFAPILFERLGVKVIKKHCFLHGDYPYHIPDPEEKIAMDDAATEVLSQKADLGVGFDADGDRFGIIDEKGQVYENDKIMILLARDILKRNRGAKVLFDIKSSFVLPKEIEKAGGVPIMMQTGNPYFRATMEDDPQILLGGEVSGHTFIKDNYYGFDDGLFAAARVMEILSRAPHPFSEFFKDVVKTAHTEELRLPCPDNEKFEIEKAMKKEFRNNWETIEIDGVRVKFSETAWALVRASNTSPYLSLRFEAENDGKLREIIEIVEARLQKYPVVDTGCLKELLS